MDIATLPKLKKYNTALLPNIIAELEIPSELFDKIQLCPNEMDVFNQLVDAKELDQAVKFLALGLPKREAVWWAYICVEQAEKNIQDPKMQGAFKLINDWVRAPTEELRRAAKKIADVLELYTPISWVA